MANINVTYGELEGAASQLGAGREEITSRLQSMQSQIGQLVSSGFVTDQASGKFNDAYTRYTQSANNVISELAQIESFLRQTASAMSDMDAQIASKIR